MVIAVNESTAKPTMLSLEKISIRAAAYYLELAHANYYIQGGEPPGEWQGAGAKALGLSGEVSGEAFQNLFKGFSPDGTRPLVQNAGKKAGYHKRVPGWDLTFSPPKSVSVCWALAPEPVRKKIERVHEEAVRMTLAMVEEHAGITRSGSGGWKQENAALSFALFQHGTSRAQDPQLHTHAVCFNLGLRSNDGWGALKSDQLFDLKMAFGALYRCQLAHLLQSELSYPVERNGAFFEIKGVDRKIIEFFSTRRAEIIDYCRKHGGYDSVMAEKAALKTRAEKSHVAREILFAAWAKAAAELGWSSEKVVGLQTRKAEKTSWTAEMKALSADIDAALRASSIKPSKAEVLQTVAESVQASGLSARQVLIAIHEALRSSKTKLSSSNGKAEADRPFADRLSEAKANAEMAEGFKRNPRAEEFRKKWEEAAAKHKAERERREKHARRNPKQLGRRDRPVSAKAARKRRSEFAVIQIGRLKNRRYPFKTIELRVFNVDIHASRLFQRAPWWSPLHYAALPAFAATSDFAPHKIRRRLTIPLRDAKHAALRQIRQSVVTAFKAGARLVWIKDERLEKLGQSINDGRRFLRQFRKPRVLVGKSDGHAWRGVLDDWERSGGMTRPEGSLILCQTRAAAERLNAEVQKERRNQGRIGLRSIKVGEETLHQHDRITFRSSFVGTDIKNLDQISIGDFGTVTKVTDDRITIRTDAGVEVELKAKKAPDIRLAYAAAHGDSIAANPKQAFILFEGKGPDQELEAIKARALDCSVRVYAGPDLAECFTVEGQQELKHRIGIRETDAHDKTRDEAWKKEAHELKARTESKSQGPSEKSAQGSSEKETQGDHASGTNRTESSYWNAKEAPTPQFFEDQRNQREERDRVERATERREAKEDRNREAEERKARREAKQAKERSESSGTIDQTASAKPIVSRSPFERVSETKSYWTGEGVPRPGMFEDKRNQREEQDRVERATERREAKEDRNRDAEERKAQRAAKQTQEGSASSAPDQATAAKPIVSRSPFQRVSETASYWTGEGVPRPSPFEAERDRREKQDGVERTTERGEAKEDRNREAEERKAQRAAKQANESSASGGHAKPDVVAPIVSPSPTYPGSDTKLNRTGNGGLGRGLFEKERHQDEAERRMEEERRRREEEEKRRQVGKAPTQSNNSQSNSQSQSHSHSHSH